MNQNQKGYRRPIVSSGAAFDIKPPKPAKPAATFPAVGMTLPSYAKTDFKPALPPRAPGRFARFRSKFTLKRVVLTILALIVVGGGWLGWKFAYNAHKLFGGSVFSILSTTKLNGESSGRVNILLAGNSADDPGHQGADLTDSIMIMSIDTKDNTAFMLSIPRDLYVATPGGSGHQKINALYPLGQSEHFSETGYAGGGMGLLEKAISQDFGITINYYALVNYDALKDAVNDVGGIDFTVASSDKRGLYDPSIDYATHGPLVKLTNGTHHLDGEQALDLARARGDAYGSYGFANSDFERTANQRQLILALRAKATTAGVLANPIKLAGLFDAIGSNVTTDFQLSEIHRLYDITKNIPSNGIQSLSLNSANGQNLLTNYTTPSGESALIPAAGIDDYSDIQQYVDQLTSTNPVVREGAKVVVLNGTNTVGLAAKISSRLHTSNVNVVSVADADSSTVTTTQIIDTTGGKKPATLTALTSALSNAIVTTTNPYAGRYTADFIVVVGSDQVSAPPQTGN